MYYSEPKWVFKLLYQIYRNLHAAKFVQFLLFSAIIRIVNDYKLFYSIVTYVKLAFQGRASMPGYRSRQTKGMSEHDF